MKEPVKTFDNPVKISEWFSYYSLGNRIQKTSGSINLSYLYDALGNRVKRTSGPAVTKYIVDPNRLLPSVLAETDASGNITAYYVYGLGLLSKIERNNAYFYQYDGLGSTVAITNKDGIVINRYAYDDFGNLAKNSSEVVNNPFKYIGRYGVMTDVVDLLYMRARFYMPSLGRFINKDPIGFEGEWNLYSYVGSNVINLIDPEGEHPLWIAATATVLLVTYAIQLVAYSFGKYPPSGLRGGATATEFMYKVGQYNKRKVFRIDSWTGWPKKDGNQECSIK